MYNAIKYSYKPLPYFFFNLRKISQVLVIRVHVLWYFIVRKDEEEEEKGKGKEKEGRLLLGNGEEKRVTEEIL